jgi:hypothetical protein
MGETLDVGDATSPSPSPELRPRASEGSTDGGSAALTAVKAVHTMAWFSIEGCMLYLLYAGLAKRSDLRAAIAGAVVAGEIVVFAGNGFRCPLTDVAERLGANQASVTDIYLPAWFARNLPAIHVPLVFAAAYLNARNVRDLRGRS